MFNTVIDFPFTLQSVMFIMLSLRRWSALNEAVRLSVVVLLKLVIFT